MADDDDGQKASAPQAITKPICSAALFEKAISRYEGLELDVFDKLKTAYTLTAQQQLEINEITKR